MAITDFKRYLVPGALVIGGVTAGSMLAPVAFAAADEDGADDNAETTEPTSDSDGSEGHHGRRAHRAHRVAAEVVTETLGLTNEELRDAFEDGKSLAGIAADQGVPVEDLKAAMMAEAQERLDQAVADERIDAERAAEIEEKLSEHIEEAIHRTPGEGIRHRHPHRHFHSHWHFHPRGDRGAQAEALAEFLGITTDDLKAGFEDGQTLAEVAEAQGVGEDDLVAFLLEAVEERLDTALENGRIEADDVDNVLAEAESRIEENINAEPGERRPGVRRGHGHRHFGGGDADGDADADGGA